MRPTENKVIVKVKESAQMVGGIYIPQLQQKIGFHEGEIVAVGPGKYMTNGQLCPVCCKVGDRIMFNKAVAAEIKNFKDTDGVTKTLYVMPDYEAVIILDEGESADDAETIKQQMK